jgi:predicted dehydrogenase
MMRGDKKVRIGLCGAGFAGRFHANGIQRVCCVDAAIEVLCDPNIEVAREVASKYAIPHVCQDFNELLCDKSINVIDICAPTAMHHTMIEAALAAGKHVICEKPLSGYFGEPGDPPFVGGVSKKHMYESVIERLRCLRDTVKKSGLLFMYAENWIYAPAVAKTAEILRMSKDKIMLMKADESHSGAHTRLADEWKNSGGGALLRQGCHPLSAVLFLKRTENAARGEKYSVADVYGDVGYALMNLVGQDRGAVVAQPKDVEDTGVMHITFGDGTKAAVFASDAVTGGIRNKVEVNTTKGNMYCNICQNDSLVVYAANDEMLKDVYVTGNIETKSGYQYVMLDEEWFRGQVHEFQDFTECVALGREPLSNIDIAYETSQLIYAAYMSAEAGRKLDLSKL